MPWEFKDQPTKGIHPSPFRVGLFSCLKKKYQSRVVFVYLVLWSEERQSRGLERNSTTATATAIAGRLRCRRRSRAWPSAAFPRPPSAFRSLSPVCYLVPACPSPRVAPGPSPPEPPPRPPLRHRTPPSVRGWRIPSRRRWPTTPLSSTPSHGARKINCSPD